MAPLLADAPPDAPAGARRRSPARAALGALRPHQWVKNVLVVVPLVTSHQLVDPARVAATLAAVAAFCLCASGGYVVNDLLDRDADRRHPAKRHRPLASGRLSPRAGVAMAATLPLLSLALAAVTGSGGFVAALVVYFLASVLYSAWLKQKLLLDVIVLAGLYTLRVIAGALAIDVPLSAWLLAFSMFLFLSLAFVKRYAELTMAGGAPPAGTNRRNYTPSDLGMIESVGPTGGYIAVLVLALYVNSDQVRTLYRNPAVVWLLCPVLMYWVTRIWFIAKRRALGDDGDPINFALRDRVSWACAAAGAGVVAAGWLWPPAWPVWP
jgi:4-hydroxybenzoate polyprenyltransferase